MFLAYSFAILLLDNVVSAQFQIPILHDLRSWIGLPASGGEETSAIHVEVRMPPSMTTNFDTNASWQGPPSGW